MASEGEDWPDVEGAIRTFLRNDPGVAALVGKRVFFSVPKKAEFPMILVTRIGGGESAGEAPLDLALIQFDIYGKKADEAGGGRAPVAAISSSVKKAISKIRGRVELVPGVTAFNARIASTFYSALPGDDRPRIIITAVIPAMVTADRRKQMTVILPSAYRGDAYSFQVTFPDASYLVGAPGNVLAEIKADPASDEPDAVFTPTVAGNVLTLSIASVDLPPGEYFTDVQVGSTTYIRKTPFLVEQDVSR